MNDLISGLNPFSSRYQALLEFDGLTLLSKLTVLFVTAITSLATAFICTALVFRLLVGRLKPLKLSLETTQTALAKKINETAKPILGENSLPLNEETFLYLLSFLDKNTLLKAMQTCRNFRRIGADDSLWRDKTEYSNPEGKPYYEYFIRKKEIAFRVKSPSCNPKQTRLENLYETNAAYKNFIVSVDAAKGLRIYDSNTKITLPLKKLCTSSFKIYEDKLFVGSYGKIEIYDLKTGETLKIFNFHPLKYSPVTGVVVQEGKIFGVFHHKLVIWDLETDSSPKYLQKGHFRNIHIVLYHQGQVITFGEDQMQILWDLEKESVIDKSSSFKPILFFEDRLLALRNADNVMTLFDFKTQNLENISFFSPDEHFKNSEFILDTGLFHNKFTIQSPFQITVGDLKENKLLYNLFPYHSPEPLVSGGAKFKKIKVSDGKIIASTESRINSKILVWDLETGIPIFSFLAQNCRGFIILEDEKVIVCGYSDSLEIWDLETGLYKKTIRIPEDPKTLSAIKEGKILIEYEKELLILDFSEEI